MRRSIVAALSIGYVLLSPGCGPNATGPPPPAVAGLTLELDGGNRWVVDDHTRTSAREMAALVESAPPIDSIEDARRMAASFDESLQVLIAGCTMEGPAHDQLHQILAALFPRVKELRTQTDLEALRRTRGEIRSIFDSYRYYFR